jgi:ribosomal protein S12 methylthiotransferase accessory factor
LNGIIPGGVIGVALSPINKADRRQASGETARILSRAVADAQACGVTRLADVTGLDNLGVPVFQAVRPLGRTVTVHQGKALTPRDAMIGALMEAVECDHAETFAGETWLSAFADLPPAERSPVLSDFAATRDDPPRDDEAIAWVRARRILDGRPLWAPFDVISLDLGRPAHPRLGRSSVGLAARHDLEGAMLKGLQEVIERDSEQAWMALPSAQRTRDRLESGAIPYAWFRDLRARIGRAGLSLAIYQLDALARVPVLLTELTEPGAPGCLRRRAYGLACRAEPEDALRASLTEAAQARLTAISGARDDILYEEEPPGALDGFGLGLPPPAHIRPRSWAEVEARIADQKYGSSAELAQALARAGYPDSAVIDLSRAPGGAVVVKVIVPGLGAFGRTRRPPTWA